MLGWMSTRVLGQYDLLIIEEENPHDQDIVYYVGPNVLALEKQFAFPPREFRLWLALHEVTHRAQFTGVPWMRDALPRPRRADPRRGRPRPQALRRRARTGRPTSMRTGEQPAGRRRASWRWSPADEQREVLDQVSGLMSLLEGHGDVTMDRAGAGLVPERRPLRPGPAPARDRPRAASPGCSSNSSASRPSSTSTTQGEAFIEAVEAAGRPGPARPGLGEPRSSAHPRWRSVSPAAWIAAGRARPRRLSGVGRRTRGAAVTDRGRAGGRLGAAAGPLPLPPAGHAGRLRRVGRRRLAGAARPGRGRRVRGRRRCTSTTGCDPGRRTEARSSAAAAAPLRGRRSARWPWRSAPGPNLEARARAARHAALPARRPARATPPTTRPRPCCCNLLRGARARRAWPASAGRRAPPDPGAAPGETEALCRELGLGRRRRSLQPRPGVPAQPGPPRGDAAARRHRRPGRGRGARPAGRAAGATSVDHLDAEAAALDPTDAARSRQRTAGPGPRGGAPLAADRARPERHPPDAATVERVLAVARVEAVATDVGGGWRVARTCADACGSSRRGGERAGAGHGAGRVGSRPAWTDARCPPMPDDDPQLGPGGRSPRTSSGPQVAELGQPDHRRLRRDERRCWSAC